MQELNSTRAFRWFGLATWFVGVGLMGCAAPQAEPIDTEWLSEDPVGPPVLPEPALRVAGDGQLTLFGELPDQSRVPYQARAASSMRQHSFATEGADYDADVSPNGRWIVFSSTRHSAQPDLYLKTIDGRAVTKITDDPAADVQPCFSPDGKRIAFASNRGGKWDIWMVGIHGGQARQITRSPHHEVHPSFSPDGQRLACCMFNDKANQWELWTLQLDQPGSRRMIGQGLFPEWSPTTDSIVYQRARERGGRWFSIWRVEIDDGEPKFPVELAASSQVAYIQPSWSPDGTWITYGSARLRGEDDLLDSQGSTPSRGDIWIMRLDGSSPLQLTDGAGLHFGPVWSTDRSVYFTSFQTGSENIWSIRPSTESVTQVPMAANDKAVGARPVQLSAMQRRAKQGR